MQTGEEKDAVECLKACAIFGRLGFYDEVAVEYQTLAGFEDIDADYFYKVLQPFVKKGVLTKRGRYVEIRPKPLAWRLAADWWSGCSPDKAKRLASLGLSEGMTEALCARIRMLDGVQEFVELTKGLCVDTAPFGQAELLNSETGSRLFRAFCEVNPSACMGAMKHVADSWSSEDLKASVGPGRRHLVWALERLGFWSPHFCEASRILLRFAASENENWSNNATGTLIGFFSPLLSGTQASPDKRLMIAREAISSAEQTVQLIGVRCLGAALNARNYSRTGGSEQQGSRPPLQEWRPKIWQDIFDYWHSATSILANKVTANSDLSARAGLELCSHLRDLFLHGRLATLDLALEALVQQDKRDWPPVVDALRVIERYDIAKTPPEGVALIKKWQTAFTPQELVPQLALLVANAPWDHEERASGEFVDVSAEKAVALAHALAKQPGAVLHGLNELLFGEQRQTYLFAREVARLSSHPNRLFVKSLRLYLSRDSQQWNYSFISGLIEGIASRSDSARWRVDELLHSGHRN